VKKQTREDRIPEPQFVRDFDPEAHTWRRPPRHTVWQRHFELCRANSMQWMKVSEAKKGGCKRRRQDMENDRQTIRWHLDRFYPLERWQLKVVTLDGTWCDRELYIRFLGELTPEQDAADRAVRAETQAARMAQRAINRERREQQARDKALEEQAKAQIKIRARRPPGT
jgi:hypothetical protein